MEFVTNGGATPCWTGLLTHAANPILNLKPLKSAGDRLRIVQARPLTPKDVAGGEPVLKLAALDLPGQVASVSKLVMTEQCVTATGIDPPPLNWSTLKYVFGRRRRTTMLKKRHKPEEIVAKLRQVEVLTSQGKSVADAIRTIGVTEVTYYRWRQEFGGLKSDQVKRLKNLEAENARLRRAVSDLTLDKMILAEAARGNY